MPDDPHFPRELEQEILETAAALHPRTVPTLLLVARRVHFWLEPLLYRYVHLQQDGSPPQEAFLRAAYSKPPDFLARGVRRVAMAFIKPLDPQLLSQVCHSMPLCTGLRGLAISTHGPTIDEEIRPLIESLTLHRLSVSLNRLMPSLTSRDTHAFRVLTHLEVFDDLSADTCQWISPFLVALPALTHLAFNEMLDAAMMQQLLDGCVRLHVFIILSMMSGSPTHHHTNVELPMRDPRVVVTVYDRWFECISEESVSYWCAAERFIEQKKLGLIDANEFWTGDFHREAADRKHCIDAD
ncbi:hypothetical protein C8F01DRAFT_1370380 [Mycena amicta]|nr:hypothetical protein C8F01DRAFT_1370380 [Mycena amicta]